MTALWKQEVSDRNPAVLRQEVKYLKTRKVTLNVIHVLACVAFLDRNRRLLFHCIF